MPRILVSVMYTYAIIIQAAKMTQASERWKDDEKINTLMFSSKWVRTFLNRANMRRRKITIDDKLIPSDEEIRRIMEIGQKYTKITDILKTLQLIWTRRLSLMLSAQSICTAHLIRVAHKIFVFQIPSSV